MKLNKRKSLFESNSVAIMTQSKHISYDAIFQRILYFFVIEIFFLIDYGRELYEIVGVYFDAPICVAFHFEEMFSTIVVDDGIEQIGVDVAEVTFTFEFIFVDEEEVFSDEGDFVDEDVQVKHVDLLVVSQVPDSHCGICRGGVQQVWVGVGNIDGFTGSLMSFEFEQIFFGPVHLVDFDDT